MAPRRVLNVPAGGQPIQCVIRLPVDRNADRVPLKDSYRGGQFRELYALESHSWTFF